MPAKRGFDRGTTFQGPLRSKFKLEGQSREFEDIIFRWNPRLRVDELYDLNAENSIIELAHGFVNTSASADLAQLGGTTTVARAYFRMPRAGILTDIGFVAEDGITQHASNKYTFTGLNLQTAADGNRAVLDTTAHVNTTDTDAAALNGGTNLTAKVFYSFALSGTTANLYVKEGDVIEITATGASSAPVVDAAQCRLKLRCLPQGLKPTVTHTGGATTNVPIAIPVTSSANGEALLQLSATNEVQTVRLDFGDQLVIPATRAPLFSCRFKMSAAPSAVQRAVIGLSTAYTATLDNTAELAWFRIDGGNSTTTIDVRAETDDNTTDRDDQATGVTLTADTYYVLSIDLADTGRIRFWIDDNVVATLAAKDLTVSHLLQPMIALQKDSGTGTPSVTIDWVRLGWNRL